MIINNKIKGIIGGIIPFICGIFGALSGSDNSSKIFRRYLIPTLITGYAYMNTDSVLVITIMLMIGAFSIGYGVPSIDDPKPSKLGYFWFTICKGNEFLTNLFTRGTVGLLVSISMLSIPIIYKKWVVYGICSSIIILTYSLLSWRNLGTYKIFGKKLLISETILYFIITLCETTIIYIK